MTFVFPVQRALVALGVTDVFSLVAAGRLFITAIAALNVWILYRIGLSLSGDCGTALLAAGLLAVSHLHMAYGSAELPRIVATAFLVPAFGLLLTPTPMRCALAGILLGLGAAMRFGEVVFAAPAVLSVFYGVRAGQIGAAWRVRVARAAVLLAGFAVAFLFAIGVSDALYWGRAFHSLLTIFDFTLVQRLSSSGFQPPWFYLTHISDWSDLLLVVLACLAPDRGSRRALLWAVLPLVLLSLLMHKETRYAIPTIPFFALAAAATLRSWIARGEARAPRVWHVRVGALGIVLLVGPAAAYDAGKFRFIRSEAAVRLGWIMGQSQRPGSPPSSCGASAGTSTSTRRRRSSTSICRGPTPSGCCATRCAGRTCIGQRSAFARCRPRCPPLERLRAGTGAHRHGRWLPAVPQAVAVAAHKKNPQPVGVVAAKAPAGHRPLLARQTKTAGAPCGAPAGGTCERRPRRAVVGTRQNVTRVTICSVRGGATPLTAPNPSEVRRRPEVGDRRVARGW